MITVHIVILKSVNNLRATVFEAGRYAWGLCHDNMLLEAGARKEPITRSPPTASWPSQSVIDSTYKYASHRPAFVVTFSSLFSPFPLLWHISLHKATSLKTAKSYISFIAELDNQPQAPWYVDAAAWRMPWCANEI